MTDAEVLAALDDRQALALTAWAEARQVPRGIPSDHSPVEELIAVMVVVRNRAAKQSTRSYKTVCLAPFQFSCWNAGSGSNHDALLVLAEQLVGAAGALQNAEMPTDPRTRGRMGNAPALDPLVRECLYLADGVIAGTLIDRTNGATSYWAPAAMHPPGSQPVWANGKPRLLIGDQYFVTV